MSDTRYCLYARKSSESDERQTMSIDSQIKEMHELAQREKLNIVEVRQESHSAKKSGNRPVFVQLLSDIDKGLFTGILTWAPDRLSRNAGDLGSLVDLMDQGKLHEIKTYSQSFGNNPNEKFLLMILCSQAKLENDNRGINVKRGLKAKCQMGIRPGTAPLGYLNVINNNRISEVVPDPERAWVVKAMFERVAKFGHSGRTIRNWLKEIGFKTRNGKLPALSRIYSTLNNPFYYGEFQYGDEWYKGKHEPLVSKEIWEKVQKQLTVPPKKWHKNKFPFKTLCICGSCGGGVTAEERYKKLKYGGFNKHIYYHCGRSVDYDCDEPYITEEDLIKQLLAHINAGNVSINKGKIAKKLKADIERFHKLRSEVLRQEYLSGNLGEIENSAVKTNDDEMAIDYLKHILKTGSSDDRREALGMIRAKFILRNKELKVA
ncbi:recombinase family protein [Candidatus Woesebacteria bacterium]|nr:recombinase family protein [Candidatus Woesebacteria bacterium]